MAFGGDGCLGVRVRWRLVFRAFLGDDLWPVSIVVVWCWLRCCLLEVIYLPPFDWKFFLSSYFALFLVWSQTAQSLSNSPLSSPPILYFPTLMDQEYHIPYTQSQYTHWQSPDESCEYFCRDTTSCFYGFAICSDDRRCPKRSWTLIRGSFWFIVIGIRAILVCRW